MSGALPLPVKCQWSRSYPGPIKCKVSQSWGVSLFMVIDHLQGYRLSGLAGSESWIHVELICPQASSQWEKVKDKAATKSSDEIISLTGGTANIPLLFSKFV